jgi:acyl transferase domain-containing protein/tryptophanase/acyl carrier protein
MNSKEIFRALQAKEISPEEAIKALKNIKNRGSGVKESIAIVGMSGRYPGASHLHQYWDNLVHAKNSIREIPGYRWDVNQYYDPRPSQKGKTYCKWLGLLEDIEYFDPLFFNISPTEAEVMDPQHRIFLQEGYKAFEDAGYSPQSLNNKKCGVYLGIMSNEYGLMLVQSQAGVINTAGNSYAIAAARIPYFLNLKGPAIPIDTACSSSLVGTHLACQALLHREIDMALVGGVSLYLTPASYISMCMADMLSPDGLCKTFDNSANGFVPGEGVGALVLKRLTDAQADRDSIYGMIIASGINHDGKTNGITAPSMKSQIELEREIYHKYKIDPGSISYVETHGTGTKLGDPIELEALSTVFKERTNQKNYCAIGSVKSNIGHISAAAGVASIQKVLLCMKYKQLVPTLNFRTPNEHFNFEDSPFYVNTALQPWEVAPGTPRRAGVSSFGFSGTNAHIIIEEPHGENYNAPVQKKDRGRMTNYKQKTSFSLPGAKNQERSADNMILFVLSAKSKEQLKIYAENMKRYIESHEDLNLADMAYTLQVGRGAMDHRLAFLADSREAVLKALEGFINNNAPAGFLTARAKKSKDEEGGFEPGEDAKTLMQTSNLKKNLEKAAELWVRGLNIDWDQLYGSGRAYKPQRISLPTYPFARERYWALPIKTRQNQETSPSSSLRDEHNIVPEVYVYDEPYLEDHTVYGERVLIGMTHGSLAINAFFNIFPGESSVHLHRLSFIEPIEVKKDQSVEVLVEPVRKGSIIDFQVMYRYAASAKWSLTAAGKLQKTLFESKKVNIESVKDSLEEFQHFNHIYTCNSAIGLGDSFKIITHLYAGKNQVLARVALTQASRKENHKYALHPLIINSAFTAAAHLLRQLNKKDDFLPLGIKDIYFRKTNGLEHCWVLVKLVKYSGEMIIFDAEVINGESQVAAYYSGCSLKRLRPTGLARTNDLLIPGSTGPQQQSQETSNAHPLETMASTNNLPGKIQKYLTNKLSTIVNDRSKLSNLEVNLMDLGLKSFQLIAMSNEIEKETNIELNPTLFFEYPNIKELTRFFSREHQDAFIQFLGIASKRPGVSDAVNQTVEIIPPTQQARQEVLNTNASTEPARDDIAVIGMFGLFAEASNLDRFWNNLRDKKDVIKEIPIDHWDYHPWYQKNPEAEDKIYCKWGSFIDDVDQFDAGFFNISPREAEWMDPQLRLLLQSIYAAGEDAGYINQLRGTNTGVFIGVCCHDYADKIAEMNLPINPYIGTGNSQTGIANRVSFFFDLTGPSVAVNTACSSSLFALHYACLAFRNKECDMAFVGGVNLLLSSWHYRYFCSIGALSPTGRCHTFDEAADGYVPGECIASILLKPLKQAKRDGDHIYAIIKGSAALHGGYTPSLTAPSVAGEENVLLRAWEDAKIHPETLSYIEAHGTGTKLGDPIEMESLKKAFKRFTGKNQFCAIGSAKAHIGHTEGAAGIAGILKVILQMKHRQIPAMPQFKKLNPYVQLDQSALYINRELEEWKSPAGVPRRAGVSSFGFSGAYAHVVIEEYVPGNLERPQITITTRDPAIIVLSAKNEDQLHRQVQRLLDAITNSEHQYPDASLADMAYTLQVGREAMEERLAVIVGSIKELQDKLEGFLEGREDIEHLYRGQVNNKDTLAVLAADEDMAKTIDAWITKRKYEKLLDLWVKGLIFDWNKLYSDSKLQKPKPRRIGLPTYPFARERYWLPEVRGQGTVDSGQVIHPLLHRNTSDFSEQRFSSTFTGQEFFLADHVVKGQRVLPGVAYLEMVRAAVEQAVGALGEDQAGIRLKDVVWARPIAVGEQPVRVHIGLFPENGDNGQIAYEIYSKSEEADPGPVVHSQGSAVLISNSAAEAPTLDINALQAECSQGSLSSTQCYEAFRSLGIDYGPGHQGIMQVVMGEGQVLAKLSLPSSVSDTQNQFVLHPSLMDSALQASIGLIMSPGGTMPSDILAPLKPALPFALQELEIFGNCTSRMWALVRYSDSSEPGDKVKKFDIDLCDHQGMICVRMKGVSARVLEGEILPPEPMAVPDTLMLHPGWKEQNITPETAAPTYAQHLVILCEPAKRWKMENEEAGFIIIQLQSKQKSIEKRFQTYAARVFAEIQLIIKEKPEGKVLIQVVVITRDEQQLFSGLSGLLKTAHLENPKLIGQLIAVDPGEDSQGILAKLMDNSRSPLDNQVLYQDGKRYVPDWSDNIGPISPIGPMALPWKDRGIYLITGGAGALGLIFAREIARQVKEPTLILVGRSPRSHLNRDWQAQLEELETLGARTAYKQVDVTRKKEVASLIQSIRQDFGSLHGIIHGAGVIRDNFILKKTKDELQEVLAPKVSGLVHLDQASKDLPLDFFILFSSTAGVTGNLGQADYSTANAFMDAYARYRNALAAAKQRQGQTLSINWPLWKEGGMHADEETEKMMTQNLGIIAMQTLTGIRALYQALASGQVQVIVIEGKLTRIKQTLLSMTTPTTPGPGKAPGVSSAAAGIDTANLPDKVRSALKQAVSELLKVRSEDIDADAELDGYGFDPIMLTQFINKLNQEYKLELNPMLFIEHPTLNRFAGYLVEEHQEVFVKRFQTKASKTPAAMDENKIGKTLPLNINNITRKQTRLPGEVNLKDRMISYLKQMISHTLKINPEQMDINKSLDKYGLDSIVVLEINKKLEQHFSNLSKTLFFEYSTINELADYFTGSHKKVLIKLFKPGEILNQTGNSKNALQQNNEPPDHILYQPLSKSKRTGYLAKQHNNKNTRFDNSIIPVNRNPLIQPIDNITGILADQIENHNLYIDDIIKLSHVDILTANNGRHIKNGGKPPITPARDLPGPRLIHETELENNPELTKLITDIDNKYPPTAYLRLSYPYFFILPGKSKYVRLFIDQSNKLIIPFVNMDEFIYQELFHYSQKINHQLLMVDRYRHWLDSNQTRLILLGVWQNLDINQFTLKGNKMRKLRYLIGKFKKSGEVKTEEYDSKSRLPFNDMRDLMIKWSESKKNIIHHSFVCMEDLLQQTLPAGHRAFLTYCNKKPCSIIVIERVEDGIYLMDQEFYDPKSAPLGHLEYTIVEIIEQLKKENTKIFSLGLTWHPFIFEDHPKKDPEGWVWLKEQIDKQTLLSPIFHQGKTNYQFKKKFGAAGEPVFAYLPKNAPFSLLLNYWAVFYQDSLTAAQLTRKINQVSVPGACPRIAKNNGIHGTGEYKIRPYKEFPGEGRGEPCVHPDLTGQTGKPGQPGTNNSPLDLLTDSWFSLQSDAVKKRSAYLKTKPLQKSIEVLQTIFPFKHIFLTAQGRIAEFLFYQAFPKTKKKILTTIPWTTTLMHQLNNGFDVIELPDPSVALPQSTHLFKGEMDLETLKEQLQKESNNIALAGLEVLSNASGGHPVRLSHIRLLKTILQPHQIPLVLDASRIVRNAFLVKQYEETCQQNTIWDIVKQTAEQAEHIVTSLSKDFAVPVGGLIATNDDQLAADIKKTQILYGQTTADIESMIIHALAEQETILDLITRQMVFTKRLQDMLVQAGVPIMQPAYGHAVVIDVSQLAHGETNTQKKETFLKKLFLETGLRGGIHQVGKQKNTILDQCIRLAFPLGLTKKDEESIYNQLQHFFTKNNMADSSKQTMEATVHHV